MGFAPIVGCVAVMLSSCSSGQGDSASSVLPTSTSTTVPEVLAGLPDPQRCDGNTVEMGECLAEVGDAHHERLSGELQRLRLQIVSNRSEVTDAKQREYLDLQLQAVSRAEGELTVAFTDLCEGVRGFEGSWRGIDAGVCEIELMRQTLQVMASMEH